MLLFRCRLEQEVSVSIKWNIRISHTSSPLRDGHIWIYTVLHSEFEDVTWVAFRALFAHLLYEASWIKSRPIISFSHLYETYQTKCRHLKNQCVITPSYAQFKSNCWRQNIHHLDIFNDVVVLKTWCDITVFCQLPLRSTSFVLFVSEDSWRHHLLRYYKQDEERNEMRNVQVKYERKTMPNCATAK
jgi:hypothetical protein